MQVLSVSQFVTAINEVLGFAFPSVEIEGEISGYKVWNNRLAFFDLKDEGAIINCMLPLGVQKTPLEDGMKIRITAGPKLTQKGRFSVTVTSLELAGEGALKRAFELLKVKLEREGLFDESRKRSLPKFPGKIGLVTSTESAAYKDFLKILNQRWSGVEVLVAHVQVQGEAATEQVVGAIDYFNQLAEPVDVLVVTRGGGSLEDLAVFNTEPVTRAVAGSRTPTIVGVGHEVDISLADLAADVRAATPTDAARLVVPDRGEVSAHIIRQEQRLEHALQQRLSNFNETVVRSVHQLENFIRTPQQQLQQLHSSLIHGFDRYHSTIKQMNNTIVQSQQVLWRAQNQLLDSQKSNLKSLLRTLKTLEPGQVLKRGYAVVRLGEQIIRSAEDVSKGDSLMIQLAKGNIDAEVKNVKNS